MVGLPGLPTGPFRTPQGFPRGSEGKESACSADTRIQSLGQEDPLEKGMTTQSSILAWRIPWTEEPGAKFKQLFPGAGQWHPLELCRGPAGLH